MNIHEKKIFFSAFVFNLLGFMAIIAILATLIYMGFDYAAELFPNQNEQFSLAGKILSGLLVVIALTKIKSLYVDTKRTTLKYLETVKADYER